MEKTRFPIEQFSQQDVEDLKPAMKIGILGTVTPEGLPHLTLITTLMASSPKEVVWGQFMEGNSKKYIHSNPRTGFLIMSLDRHYWIGQADYTHTEQGGKDYDFYNNTPLFRYSSYFNVSIIHYMALRGHSGKHPLPMNEVTLAAIKTLAARSLTFGRSQKAVMNHWTKAFLDKLDNLKFLSYIDSAGYPVIIPLIQAQTLDSEQVVFSFGAFTRELEAIPPFTPVAIFGMALSMEDVLLRGTYQGSHRLAGIRCGVVQVDWVYNSMPPNPEQIYPEVPLKTITEF